MSRFYGLSDINHHVDKPSCRLDLDLMFQFQFAVPLSLPILGMTAIFTFPVVEKGVTTSSRVKFNNIMENILN